MLAQGMQRSLPWLLGFLVLGLYALFIVPMFPLTMGDGFIVAHYAENLVDHGALAFNLDERIWSFTSPLHVLLEAAFYAVSGQTIIANKVFGILAVLAGTFLVARALCQNRVERLLCWGVLFLSPCLVYWTVNGLETPYLFLAIAFLVVVMERAASAPPVPREVALIGLASALCVLLRYDTVLLVAPAVLFTLFRARFRWRHLAALLPGALLVLAWIGFAWFYYRDLVPTSFHHKTPSLSSAEVRNNLQYEIQFLILSGVFVPMLLYLGRRDGRDETERRAKTVLVRNGWLWAGLILFFVYGLSAATKHMLFGYRLFLPLLPALFAGALAVGRALGKSSVSIGRAATIGILVAALQCATWAHLMFRGVNPTPRGEFFDFDVRQMLRSTARRLEPLAEQLDQHWKRHGDPAETPRLFIDEAGLVPYRLKYMYVYDIGLISYRSHCRADLFGASHYVTLPANRPSPLPVAALADGVVIRYRVNPQPHVLPPQVSGPCRSN